MMKIPFGNPNTYKGHSGVDFPQPSGTAIRASGPGVIKSSGWHNNNAGNGKVIRYDNGIEVLYCHLVNLSGPGRNARVSEGTVLGYVGTTGRSTGNHLHMEIMVGSGAHTYDGIWRHFNRSVVGGSSWTPSGKNHTGNILKKQNQLNFLGFPVGTPDNVPGSKFEAGTLAFQQAYGLTADSINGDGTGAKLDEVVKDIQTDLNKLGFKAGAVDGDPGSGNTNTINATRAFQTSKGLKADGIAGVSTRPAIKQAVAIPAPKPPVNGHPAFPLLPHQYFGPEAGGDNSISGHHGHREDLKVWQQRMQARGWVIDPDGLYSAAGSKSTDTQTGKVAKDFQTEKGLNPVDGLIGPTTWNAAWESPVTQPVTPPVTPPSEKLDNRTSRPDAEIWAFLKAQGLRENVEGVKDYQRSQLIDADGIWGATSDGLAFPPAGSIKGVDYSFARPDPAMLKSRGIKLAGRYLWRDKYDDGVRTNKGINGIELANLRANGIDVFFIYEEDGKELLGGRAAGVRVANEAEKFLKALGLADYPIYFNVDYDAPADDLPKIMDALDGIASVIGKDRVGLYAGYGPLKAAFDAGKIAWGFQTYAWSGGRWDSRAQLQQWSNNQWNGTVDFTRAMVKEYGQNPVGKPQPPVDPPVDPPVETPVDNDTILVPRKWMENLVEDALRILEQ